MNLIKKWKNKKTKDDMDVVGHLTELRKRIITIFVFFFIFFIVGFIYVQDLYTFFINDIDIELMVISPAEIIWIYLRMAGVIAVCGTIPVLAYQLWSFIKPGLTKKERRVSLAYIPFLFLLFIGGLAFGYSIFVQFIFPFILSLSEGMFDVMITVDRYFSFLFRVTIPFAIIFELPIAAIFLTTLGVITPDYMRKIRKYAYFALIVISTMLTPPDFLMPLLVSLPMIILYEVSIIFSTITYKKKAENDEELLNDLGDLT